MTRAQLRRFTRSKLGDMHPTSPKFLDSDINLCLLNKARQIQNWVNVTDPNPYVQTLYGDLVSGQKSYPLPSDYRSPGVREVALLQSGVYVPIDRAEFNVNNKEVAREVNITGAVNKYSIGGGVIKLKIAPTANQVAGIRIEYSALVTFGDDDDAIIQLPLELHDCVYLLVTADLSQDLGYLGYKDYYTQAKLIYDGWAEGFKTTIGPDKERISNVGGLNKRDWPNA